MGRVQNDNSPEQSGEPKSGSPGDAGTPIVRDEIDLRMGGGTHRLRDGGYVEREVIDSVSAYAFGLLAEIVSTLVESDDPESGTGERWKLASP